jgi:hypothetical protein
MQKGFLNLARHTYGGRARKYDKANEMIKIGINDGHDNDS